MVAQLPVSGVKGFWSSLKQKWQARRIQRQRVQLRHLLGRLTLNEKWVKERLARSHEDNQHRTQ